MMQAVAIPDHERRFNAWPHELSGGMAQRVMIAAASINEPKLLLADEPTTGLDVTVQVQILDLLRDMVRARNMAMVLITHDLGVVAHYCDCMAVMFSGTSSRSGPFGMSSRVPLTRTHARCSRRHPATGSAMAALASEARRRICTIFRWVACMAIVANSWGRIAERASGVTPRRTGTQRGLRSRPSCGSRETPDERGQRCAADP